MATVLYDVTGPYFYKDAQAILDYTFDWSAWLNGETIATAAHSITGSITKASESNTGTTTTAWISGGTVGETATVTSRITTSGGRQDDRTLRLKIKER